MATLPINSAQDLYDLLMNSTSNLNRSFIQTANIDMTGFTSKSIAGTETDTPYNFSGTYDGGGFTITIYAVETDWTGLFDSVVIQGVIRNVNVIYSNALSLTVSGTNFNDTWGGLVGDIDVATISNCSVTFNNTIQVSAAGGVPIGLLCGLMAQNSSMSNSRVVINAAVTLAGGDNSNIGLICGQSTDSTITNCSVSSSSSSYNISLTVNDSSSVPSSYSSIGLMCGFFGTSFTQLNQPLLTSNTVNLNNNGNVTLNNTGTGGTTYIGAICGTMDGDSVAGTTDATDCIVNINNNQTLVRALTDFGQLIDNTSIQGSLFSYITTTGNSLVTFSPKPSPPVSVTYINSITNNYPLSSGNYYIPNTTGSIIIGPQTISLESQTSPAGIKINGTLYANGTSYSSANSAYSYTIYVKGVGSMYFGLDILGIANTADTPEECICQVNNCSTNPQTGITGDSRITNTIQDKTIRVNVDREFATKSVVYPKFKSYSDYMKYLQAGLKY